LAVRDRTEDSIDGGAHLWEEKRIAQTTQPRPKEFLGLRIVEEASPDQKPSNAR
jgi:hypothetical protein